MSKHTAIHVVNWLRPTQTVCHLSLIPERKLTTVLQEVTCSVCGLILLRTGQRLGLEAEKIGEWTLEQLQAWKGEP